MKKKFLLLAICFIFISCEPPHNIFFVNHTDYPAKVILKVTEKPKSYDLTELATGDSIIFNLSPKAKENIYFGIGDWTDEEIKLLTSDF